MVDRKRRGSANTTRVVEPPDQTPGAIYPRWIEGRVAQNQIRGIAGERLELDAADWIDTGCGPICWTVSGESHAESRLTWTPRSSGLHQIGLRAGDQRRKLRVLIGLRVGDLVVKREALDYFFALVARDGLKLHIVPLIGQNPGCAPHNLSKLVGEVAAHHPAFADFMRAQTSLYRRRIVPRMFVDARKVATGLYAVMSHDLVYLGSSSAVEQATELIRGGLDNMAKTGTGRGRILSNIKRAVDHISPLEYQISRGDEIRFPRLTRQCLGTFSTERFFYDIVTSLVAEVLRFGNRVGARVGLGAATPVITFDSANATLTTHTFDPQIGFARQATTGIDIFSIAAPRTSTLKRLPRPVPGAARGAPPRAVAARRIGVDAFGNPAMIAGAFGGLLDFGGFGSGFAPRSNELTGSMGDGPPISGGGGGDYDYSSNGRVEPGSSFESGTWSSDIENHQVVGTENGKVYVVGDDGSIVGFDFGPNGPDPIAVGVDENGDPVLYGDTTVINFGADEGETVEGNSGRSGGDSGGDDKDRNQDQSPVDAGTPTGPTGDAPTAAGTPQPDDGDGGGDDPESPRFGGGIPGSSSSPPPGPPSFDGGMPSRGMGGVVTRGGGYTDPRVGDDGQGGGGDTGAGAEGRQGAGGGGGPSGASGGGFYIAGGGLKIIPGGGVVDPPSDLVAAGGFQFWGGYVAPLGGEADPNLTGGAGMSGPPTARTITVRDGVHIEDYLGETPAGFRADGLFGAGVIDTGKIRRL